jgi:hypothetical protein
MVTELLPLMEVEPYATLKGSLAVTCPPILVPDPELVEI